jgi:hypothetical protein
METIIFALTLALFCFGIFIVYWAIRARKRAMAEQEKIHRVLEEANRALKMINSNDSGEIIIGLHMLSVYDIPSIRMKAFPRLMELIQATDKQVAELAKYVIELSQSQALPVRKA